MPDTDVSAAVEGVISKEGSLADIKQAVSSGADVNALKGKVTPLLRAVQEQRADIVQCLLECKADPDLADPKGVGPLHMAIFDGIHDVVQSLIDARADVDKRDRHGQTPIFFAPHRKACAQLGAANADVNVVNSKGQSALHLAAHAGLNDAVLWLAENMKPSTINVQDRHGRTAVYCAAHSNLKSTILLLQERGADLSLRPHKYALAKEKKHRLEGTMSAPTSPAQAEETVRRREWVDNRKPQPLSISTDKGLSPPAAAEFEVISPKRTMRELRHLQDSGVGPDSDVLSVLQSTLTEGTVAAQTSPTLVPFSGYYCAYVRPAAPYLASLYPQFTKRPTPSAAAPAERLPPAQLISPAQLTQPLSPVHPLSPAQPLSPLSPIQAPSVTAVPSAPTSEVLPFAAYYSVNLARSPDAFFAKLHATYFPARSGPVAATPASPTSPLAPSAVQSPMATSFGTAGLSPTAAATASAAPAAAESAAPRAQDAEAAKAPPGEEDEEYWKQKEEEGAVKIQTIFRGKKTRRRMTAKASAAPIPKTDWFGAKVWEVVLTKKESKQKYGFSHSNAKTDFLKEYVKSHGNAESNGAIAPLPEGPEALIVKKVGEHGLLEEWNFVHEDAQVNTGDRVFQVNDKVTIQEMQKELRRPSVKMKVMHLPDYFDVTIEKRPGARKLGFKFEKPANATLLELKITEVTKDGLLDEVNRRHMAEGHHHLVALTGMRIEAANDVTGDGTKIAEELRRCEKVTLRIRRAAAAAQAKMKVQQQIKLINAFRLK